MWGSFVQWSLQFWGSNRVSEGNSGQIPHLRKTWILQLGSEDSYQQGRWRSQAWLFWEAQLTFL